MRRGVLYGLLATILILLAGCKGGDGDGEIEPQGPPALLTVTKHSTDLLFRYESGRNASGVEYSVAPTIDDVPKDAREAVVVVDLNQSPDERQAGRYAQIFDLRKPNPDGSYPGRVVSLVNIAQINDEAARRLLASERQTPVAGEAKAAEKGPVKITMYSTAWCGVCKRAKRFMDRKGIPYVEKDIEKDQAAMKELSAKAAAAGTRVRGVPVFDVGGALIPGFDKDKILALSGR